MNPSKSSLLEKEGSIEDLHLKVWKDPIFLTFINLLIICAASSPIFAKLSFSYWSWPCPDHDCTKEKYNGFLASVAFKYIFMTIANVTMWFGIEKQLRLKKNKKMIFHELEDYTYNKELGNWIYWHAIPGSMIDFTATNFERIGMYYCKASTAGLIGLFSILVSAVGRAVMEREGLLVCEYLGLAILFLGAGFAMVDALEDDEVSSNPKLGIILSFIGAMVRGCQYVWHNYIRKYRFPQIKYSNFEAFNSLLLTCVIMVIYQLTGYVNIYEDFWATTTTWQTFFYPVMFGLTGAFFQISSTVSSKYISGTYRIFIVRGSSLGTWVLELAIGLGRFSYWELGSFIFLIIGLTIFGGLIATSTRYRWLLYFVPCCGLKPPAIALPRRKDKEKDRVHSADQEKGDA